MPLPMPLLSFCIQTALVPHVVAAAPRVKELETLAVPFATILPPEPMVNSEVPVFSKFQAVVVFVDVVVVLKFHEDAAA